MIPIIRRVVDAFLFDESKGPRWFALALVFVGKLIEKGGQIPGTNMVLPLGPLTNWASEGTLLVLAGIAIATACGTPIATDVAMAQKAADKKP